MQGQGDFWGQTSTKRIIRREEDEKVPEFIVKWNRTIKKGDKDTPEEIWFSTQKLIKSWQSKHPVVGLRVPRELMGERSGQPSLSARTGVLRGVTR